MPTSTPPWLLVDRTVGVATPLRPVDNEPVPHDGGMVDGVVTGERSRLRLLQGSTFTSNFDRFAIAPLLVPIGLDLGAWGGGGGGGGRGG